MDINQKGIIIWDWNGTLLDDVDICIESMNRLLERRNLPLLTLNHYRQIFTFPVKDYYKHAGFNFSLESFDDVAVEFIDAYREIVKQSTIFEPVKQILQAFKTNGYRQFLISAMEHEFLKETLKSNEVLNYFESFSGIKDHFANGKLKMAKRFFEKNKIETPNVHFIGDTIHDFEVAEGLGVKSVLVASGHQSRERLKETGTAVFEKLSDLTDFFQLNGNASTIIKSIKLEKK